MNRIMNILWKRTRSLWFVSLLLLTACSSGSEMFIGTIHTVDADNKRILVISQLQKEDLNEDYKKLLESGGYSQVIWVSKVNPRKYKPGEEIEVLYEARDDSFPAQVNAKKITRLK